MARASRLSRWWSQRPSRAHRSHISHSPSAHSSGGSCEAHEPGEGGVRPALAPAEREGGLLLRPRFDEAQEEHARDGSGVAHASSIESTETRVEKTLIWSDENST